MLCDTCIDMFSEIGSGRPPSEADNVGPHHEDSSALIKAASNGCSICGPLLHYCRRVSASKNKCVSERWSYTVEGKTHVDRFSIEVRTFQQDRPFASTQGFRVFRVPDTEVVGAIAKRNKNNIFKDACQAAHAWLQQCLNGHQKCQSNQQPSSYPTRLLELSRSKARLVIPAQEHISGPYIALSYCWGNVEAKWALTTSNLARRCEKGTPYTDLPIGFRESIAFIQNLSIRYLWVDSLCIIQSGDEGEDWRLECDKMQQVYTNCILNISLANAESPTKGYLEQDTNEIFFPFVVTIPDNGFGPRTSRSPINPRHWGNRIRGKLGEEVHDDKKGRRFLVIEENFVDRNLVSLPINGRAWVLQERFLSPRVLSLGHGQAFWNCRELSNAFESFPSSLREGDFHLSSRERFWPQSGQKLHEQEFFWNGMIQQYTSRRLTFPAKDRLVAFSAMAQRMAAFINSEYIAGHFWKQLPQSLPWQVIIHPESRPRRRDRYLLEDGRQIKTPSWSWASIDGEIQMPLMSVALYSTESIANMVDFTLDLVNDANPYGQVVSASLILQACCAEAQWTGGVPVLSGQPIKLHDYTSCNGYNVSFWWIIDDPIDELQEGDRCEVIALCRAESNQNLYGLIARRLPDRGPDSYARIGHFCMKGSIEVCRSLGLWHGEKKKITLV